MLRFRSAKDLGLKTRWRYGFVPYGSRASTTPGAVYMDVGGGEGNELLPGILDHHKQQSAGASAFPSSAAIVAARPDMVYSHLLGPWLLRADDGRVPHNALWEPLLITHVHPDWDGAAAAVLIQHLIEHGELPARTGKLVEYTNRIDQGRWRMPTPGDCHHPHLAMLAAAHLYKSDHARVFAAGRLLVQAFLDADSNWADENPIEFRPVLEALSQQAGAYGRDQANADLVDDFLVPDEAGKSMRVPAFLLREPSVCALNKYFVRAAGYPLFFCPYKDPRNGQDVVIISVDPDYQTPEGQKPSLRGLGHQLELAEIKARETRNNGHDDRPGPPRWQDGSCTNKDPWYDGRGHNHTLVQTPDCGTVQSLAGIRGILERANYAATILAGACIRLIWSNPVESLVESRRATDMKAIAGVAFEKTVVVVRGHAGQAYLLARAGSSPLFLVLELDWPSGASFEDMVERVKALSTELGAAPSYKLARIAPRQGSSAQDLLGQLGSGRLQPLSHRGSRGCLINTHNVLHLVGPAGLDRAGVEAETDAVLYAAFLRESLLAVSARLSKPDQADASTIRCEFLTFQTQFYKRELGSAASAQDTFDSLTGEMNLPGVYEEVHSQLERLSEIEQAGAQRKFEALAFVISALSFLQTVTAYFSLDYEKVDRLLLVAFSSSIPGLLLLYYLWRVRRTIEAPYFYVAAGFLVALAVAAAYWSWLHHQSAGFPG